MQEIIHRYSLLEQLGSKPFCSTYLGYPVLDDQKRVVVKMFESEALNQEVDQRRRQEHIAALKRLVHPSICPLLDIGVEDGRLYVVSDYCTSGSLRTYINTSQTKPLPLERSLFIVRQIGEALEFAHQRALLHGSIKPENVLWGGNDAVMVTDFRLAPVIDTTRLNDTSDSLAVRYMAPEYVMGRLQPASDQYSLACLAYELLTGIPPFNEPGFPLPWKMHTSEDVSVPATLAPDFPLALERVITKALSREPERRYESISAFLSALFQAFPSMLDRVPDMRLPATDALVNQESLKNIQSKNGFTIHLSPEQLQSAQPTPVIELDHQSLETIHGDRSLHKTTDKLDMDSDAIPTGGKTTLLLTQPRLHLHSGSFLIGSIFSFIVLLLTIGLPLFIHATGSTTNVPIVTHTATSVTPQISFAGSTMVVTSTRSNYVVSKAKITATPTIIQTGQGSSNPITAVGITPPVISSRPTSSATTVVKATPTSVVKPTPTAIVPQGTVNISSCGVAVNAFVADIDYDTGACLHSSGVIDTSAVTDNAPGLVFMNSRYGPQFTYTIPDLTPGYTYTIRLLFAETYWTGTGERVFDVLINNQAVLTNFDIFAAAGGAYKAIEEQFSMQPTSSGIITVTFVRVTDYAQVNGIEILS